MKFFVITTFINALCCGSCCLLILLSSYKSKSAKAFALFNSTVALWSFFYFLSMLASQFNEALFYSRTLNAIALFIPASFLNFCIKITDNKNTWVKRMLFVFFFLDIFILPFTPTKYFIPSMAPKLVFLFWPVPGPLWYFSTLQFAVIYPITFFLLKNKLDRSTGISRYQFKILFYSILIGFLGGYTNYLPFFNIPIPPYGNALVPVFIFSFIFLIFKYQIMDIKINLSRSFAYTILIFLITFLYFLATYLINTYLNSLIGYKSFIFSFLAASITALAFIPLKDALQLFIDKYFFKKSIQEIEHENKLLKQEVTQSERMRSVAILASGMAHEIKNPLTTLKTFAEYVPLKKDDPIFMEQYQKIIPQEIARIDNLVHELLFFAKPSPPQIQTINPNEIISNVTLMLSQKFQTSNIVVVTELNADTTVQADPNQIKQALLNLILNAIDAMPNGGTLTISTHLSSPKSSVGDPEHYIIQITDTGHGITPTDLPHIFEPFFTKKEKGTGLGLAITQGIIEKHGGTIVVESKLNQGTTFRIKI
jgi:signal transduction histidine kinase